MRVLVTGGSGFIGSHVVARLMAHGVTPRIFDQRRSPIYYLLYPKGSVRIILVADFVHGLLSSMARIQPIGAVDYPARFATYIPIGMNNPFRDDDHARIVLARYELLPKPVSGGFYPVIPQHKSEGRRAEKTEIIGLIFVLMRAPSRTR